MPGSVRRFDALAAVKTWKTPPTDQEEQQPQSTNGKSEKVEQIFGINTFGLAEMKSRLPKQAYKALLATCEHGSELDPSVADTVAIAMKEWAIEHGATHFTHWFQPLTGSTAEKHDSFITPNVGG